MTRTQIVRPISWRKVAVNLTILGCLVLGGWLLNRQYGVAAGAAAYLLFSTASKGILIRHHRRAILLCQGQQFEAAITEFEKSLRFFSNHAWVDDWRAVTMLSASEIRYREMALLNLGFCYAQLGDEPRSRIYYEQALREFRNSNNGMAEAALRLMEAGKKSGAE